MLFSERDGRWKLADFGTAAKATSKRLHTTRYARGTTCYRAPELFQEDARFNNKADMFALGCILYEVTTGRKLFTDDWNIRDYALKGKPVFPSLWPTCEIGSRLFSLGVLAQSLLEVNPFSRPSAMGTDAMLQLIRQGRVPPPNIILQCVAPIRPPSPPRKITLAQVHYRRSAPAPTAPVHPPSLPVVSPLLSPTSEERRLPTPVELGTMEEQPRMLGGTLKHSVGGGIHSEMSKPAGVNYKTKRRPSCDACHQQHIRCVRFDDGRSECARCARMKGPCTVMSTLGLQIPMYGYGESTDSESYGRL